jgi:hypothetical protein
MGLFCEGGETFHSGFEIVPPPSVLTIDPGVLHLGEGDAAQITVVRSGGDLEEALAVSLDAPAGVSVPGVIELEPGQPQVNVTIHSEEDTQASGDRQIGLIAAAQRHVSASASVVIQDDDAPALCGNGRLDPGEEVDPPVSRSDVVPVDPSTCRYDFSQVQQLYCGGTCGVAWNGLKGCQAGDADALCRLVTGNPLARAKDGGWAVQAAWYGSGVCCPGEGDAYGCTAIPGTLRGVPATQISVHPALYATHGPGAVVSIDGVESCEVPE